MKAIKKRLTIEIEYIDSNEIRGLLSQINSQIIRGKSYNRIAYGTSFYTFKKSLTDLPDYREEMINGVWCQIYKSKINTKHDESI